MDNRDYLIQDLQRAFSNDNSPRNEVEAAVEKRVNEIKEDLSEGRVTEEHLLELLVEERNRAKHKDTNKKPNKKK